MERFTSESTNKVVVTEIAEKANQFFGSIRTEKNEYGALMSAVVESGVALSDHFDYKFSGKKTTEEMNNLIMQKLQRDSSGQIQFGLDLQGGSSFLVEMQMNSTNQGRAGGCPVPGGGSACDAVSTMSLAAWSSRTYGRWVRTRS